MRAWETISLQYRDPDVVYAAPDSVDDVYHTTRECPYVSSGFLVLDITDDRATDRRENHRECAWCRYVSDDTLDLEESGSSG